MFPIYTAGYKLLRPEDLFFTARQLGPKHGCKHPGLVMDIRYLQESPTANALWHRKALQLRFGYDYVPNIYLGNREVGRGRIEIHKPKLGLNILAVHAESRPVVLMCACESFRQCHRCTVSKMLEVKGIQTTELTPDQIHPAPAPPGHTKALSIWPYWAVLIARGFKKIETRSWGTAYRGPVLIQSTGWTGMKRAGESPEYQWHQFAEEMQDSGYERWQALPTGSIVAVANLADCFQFSAKNEDPRVTSSERNYGDFSLGRWGWYFDKVVPLAEPVKARGQQFLWDGPVDANAVLNPDGQRAAA